MNTAFLRLTKVENQANEIGSRFHVKFSGAPFTEGSKQFSFGLSYGDIIEFNRNLYAFDVSSFPTTITVSIELSSATLSPYTVNHGVAYAGSDDGTFTVNVVPTGYPPTSKIVLHFAFNSRTKVNEVDYFNEALDVSDCFRRLMLWESFALGDGTLSGSYNDLKAKLVTLMTKLNAISADYDYGELLYKDNISLIHNFNAFMDRLERMKDLFKWVKNYSKLNEFDTAFSDFITEFGQFKSDMNSNGINPCESGTLQDVWGDLDDDFKSSLKCYCKVFALDGSLPTALQSVLNTLKTKVDALRTDLIAFQADQATEAQNSSGDNYKAISYYNQISSGSSYCDKANEVFELLEWVNKNRSGLVDISPNTVDQFINDLSSDLRSLDAVFRELEFALPGVCKEFDPGFNWSESLIQSPYIYLQACGADAADPYTEGVHLRWALMKELGENHLPKGSLANNGNTYYADFGYTKDDDFVELYKTPYSDKAIISIDLSSVNPKFEQFDPVNNTYTWTFSISSTTATTARSFKNDVYFIFADKTQYDAVRMSNNPLSNALNFMKAYTGLVEVSVSKKLMFAYKFELTNVAPGSMGNFLHEVINLPDLSELNNLRITRRKMDTGITFNVEDVGENMASIRFRTEMGTYPAKVHLETYTDFLSTRASTDWSDMGDFGLTMTDSVAYDRIDDSGAWSVNNQWPKYNDGVTVRVQNYKDKWDEVDAGLKNSVGQYLDRSKTDLKALELFEAAGDDNSALVPFSHLDILQLNALDFHQARMLGLGHIDDSSITQKYVYMVQYRTNPMLKDNRNAPLLNHHYMSLPTDKSDLRLPLKPDALVTFGLEGKDPCLLNKMQDENGHAKNEPLRFVNIHRDKYDYEINLEDFFQTSTNFDIAELALPVLYGIKYRETGSSFQKPDLLHDPEFKDYDGGLLTEIDEMVPVLDTGDKLYMHLETNEGDHQYGIYGINWFSRASDLSDPADANDTAFTSSVKILPPENIQAHYIQKENSLIFTTQTEQDDLADRNTSDPGEDNCQTRVNFNWGYLQHYTYPECNQFEFFFRENLPMLVEGKINKIESFGNGEFNLYSQSYTIVSGKEIQTITPTLSGSDYAKFVGGRLVSDGGLYTVVSISSGTLGPVIRFRAESSHVAQLGNNGSTSGFCVPVLPKVSKVFQLIENLSNEDNWNTLSRTVSIVKHSTNTITVDGEIREYGGLKGTVNVYEDTELNPASGVPGLFKIQYTSLTLSDHPEKSEGVHWNKGNLLLEDNDDVYRDLEVWSIESQSPLVVWAYDGTYENGEHEYTLSVTGTPVNANAVFHPGYKVYLSAEPGNSFDRDHIVPVSTEFKKTTFIAVRAIDDEESPVLKSSISNPIPIVAYWKKDPAQQQRPVGKRFATRPDTYGMSTYTFDLQIGEEAPFSLMCYKSTESMLLAALYDKEIIDQIYADLEAYTDQGELYQRFNDVVNGNFDSELDEEDLMQFPEYSGYRLPNVFKEEIIEGDGEFIDRYMQAINLTFYGMTPSPIVYNKVKVDDEFRLTLPIAPVLNGENGEPLEDGDPDLNLYPFAVRYNDGSNDYLRVTDYKLSGSSTDRYFYLVAEVSIEQEIGERSEAIGPIRMINSMPAAAPYIRKYETVLAYPSIEIPYGVRFYLNPYLPSEEIEMAAIYRTNELKNSDDVQLMTLAATVTVENGYVVEDNFEDVEYPPFGYDIYYRIVALRKIINERDQVEYVPSKASEKIVCKVVDNVNPPSPEITYSVQRIYAEPGRLEDINLEWDASCFEGKYTLYKMSDTGFWQKIKSYAHTDNFVYNMAYLNTEDDDGDVVYHRFKVVAENKNGLLSLDEKIATLWQIPNWFKNLPLAKFNVSDILAAYSLRKLTQGYSGGAILARNNSSSDSGIGFIDADLNSVGLLSHADGNDASVPQWYDQSMNQNNDLNLSGLSPLPRIVDTGAICEAAYGKMAIEFNSVSFEGLNETLESATSDFTFYAVLDLSGTSGDIEFEVRDRSGSTLIDSVAHDPDTFRDKLLISIYHDQTTGKVKFRLPSWSSELDLNAETQKVVIKFNGSTALTGSVSEIILLAKNLINEGMDIDTELEIKTFWNLYGTDTNYPLDLVNTIDHLGGFSLRKLKSDFTGDVIGAVNGSSVYLEVGLVDDVLDEATLESHAALGDVVVTKWLNQVDNEDLVFEQESTDVWPYIIETGVVNYTFYDQPGLRFFETYLSWMASDFDLSGTDFTIYMVADIMNGDGNVTLKVFDSDNGQTLSEQVFDTDVYTRKLLIALYYNQSSQSLTFRIQNHSKVFDFDPTYNMFAIYSDPSCLFDGSISEFLVFAKDLRKTGKAAALENNIKTHWGLI